MRVSFAHTATVLVTSACGSLLLPLDVTFGQETATAVIEEITVTAQKREENIQKVPITIDAFAAATLEQSGVSSPQDLQAVVPGFVTQQRAGSAAPSLRGVGSIDPTFTSEGVISTYVDGVYVPFMGAGTFSFNNIERIEVLKGPQGTLFGRNSVGGLINVITRNPALEFGGKVEVGYGSFDTMQAKSYITGGLTSNLAADLAVVYTDQGEGWGRNLDTGREIGFTDNLGVRSKWLLDLDATQLVLALDYNKNEEDSSIAISPYSPEDNLTVPFPTIASRGGDFYDKTGRGRQSNEVEQGGASLRISHEMDFAVLASTTAYRRAVQHEFFDQDMTAATLLNIEQKLRSNDFSQELQISSPSGGSMSWIVGAFYLHHDANLDPQNVTLPIGNFQLIANQTTESLAGYAQATLPITSGTNLTLGARYTQDEQSYTTTPLHPIAVPAPAPLSDSIKFPKATWRVALDQELGADAMVYASYSRGFKSGQWNPTVPPVPTSTSPEVLDAYEIGLKSALFDRRLQLNLSVFDYDYQNIQYNRIVGNALEAINAANATLRGAELSLQIAASGKLHAALGAVYLFEHEYTDFPAGQFFAPNPGYPTTPCFNGAPFFGVTPLCAATADMSGNTIIQSPELSLSGALNYDMPTAIGDLQLNATANYTSKIYRTIDGSLTEPSQVLVNAQIRLELSSAPLALIGWCKNVTDEEIHAFGAAINFGYIGAATAPRTFGLSAEWSF